MHYRLWKCKHERVEHDRRPNAKSALLQACSHFTHAISNNLSDGTKAQEVCEHKCVPALRRHERFPTRSSQLPLRN